jgi:AI2M/AI1M-like, HNH endonuclease/Type II intron maturase
MITHLQRERRKLQSQDPFDPDYRRLRFVRSADDFLLGFAGPKNEAEAIRDHIAEFLDRKLKLTLSNEKTLITHAGSDKAKFLGHELMVSQNDQVISANGTRSTNRVIVLLMPRTVRQKILERFSSNGKVIHRAELARDDDYTIVMRYQSVLREIYNYYCMTTNVSGRMARIRHDLETSLTKTLAHRHQISVNQVYRKYQQLDPETGLKVLRVTRQRGDKEPLIATFGGIPFVRDTKRIWGNNYDFQFKIAWFTPGYARSETVERMLASRCELCGADGVPLQMHHIRKLADLKRLGREKPLWARIMIARRRKSLAVCKPCHQDIHAGRYDGPSPRKLTGELDARKRARPVREGAVGKGDNQ